MANNTTLWLFNIAMENGPFIDGLPINSMGIFRGKLLNNQMVGFPDIPEMWILLVASGSILWQIMLYIWVNYNISLT